MLYIMRHGKTEWNSLNKLQGRTDIPLNDEGRLMALNACTVLWLNRVARFFFYVYYIVQIHFLIQ